MDSEEYQKKLSELYEIAKKNGDIPLAVEILERIRKTGEPE